MTDTLQVDTAALSAWRANDDYNYERELARSGESLWDRLTDRLEDLLHGLFGDSVSGWPEWAIWTIIGAIVVIVVVVLIFIFRPKIFFRDKKTSSDYAIGADNIYGVDFDKEIAKALARKDWREAVRLTYLRELRLLSDNKFIDWQIFKTPTKYTAEFRDNDFRQLTNLFLRVRYGGYAATETDYKLSEKLAGNVSETMWKRKEEQQSTSNVKGGAS